MIASQAQCILLAHKSKFARKPAFAASYFDAVGR